MCIVNTRSDVIVQEDVTPQPAWPPTHTRCVESIAVWGVAESMHDPSSFLKHGLILDTIISGSHSEFFSGFCILFSSLQRIVAGQDLRQQWRYYIRLSPSSTSWFMRYTSLHVTASLIDSKQWWPQAGAGHWTLNRPYRLACQNFGKANRLAHVKI